MGLYLHYCQCFCNGCIHTVSNKAEWIWGQAPCSPPQESLTMTYETQQFTFGPLRVCGMGGVGLSQSPEGIRSFPPLWGKHTKIIAILRSHLKLMKFRHKQEDKGSVLLPETFSHAEQFTFWVLHQSNLFQAMSASSVSGQRGHRGVTFSAELVELGSHKGTNSESCSLLNEQGCKVESTF